MLAITLSLPPQRRQVVISTANTRLSPRGRAKTLKDRLGKYSVTALTADVIANFGDTRIKQGQSASSVRLELALLSHL